MAYPCASPELEASAGVQVDGTLANSLKAALAAQMPLQGLKEGRVGGSPDKMAASKA